MTLTAHYNGPAVWLRVEEEPHVNSATGTPQFALRDLDDYYVMVSAQSADLQSYWGSRSQAR
jgi:hypothetical protein